MYTVCPGCTRQFQIYAEHLSAAAGQVRCGFCHEQFNAMDRLYDEPLSNEKILNEQLALQENKEEEPQFEIPEVINPELVVPEEDVFVSNNESETVEGLQTAINEIGIRPSVDEIKKREDHLSQNSIAGQEEVLDQSEAITIQKEFDKQENLTEQNESEYVETEISNKEHFKFTEADKDFLLEEPVKKSRWSWIVPLFWTSATLAALVVILGQLAWFNRDRVLLEYPELIPYAKKLCDEFDCQLIREKDVSKIKLVNRDVRLHPTYQDTLLVNAAMKNELSIRQPYPKVQLTLFDTSGSLLGYREFMPTDYLDSSIEIDKGMPVESPVYFVLEVSGPTAGAVSFEFRFL